MSTTKSSFLDKVLGRIGRIDGEGLRTVVERLARERQFLETLFNAINDGVLVVDEKCRILYLNAAVTRLVGIPAAAAESHPLSRYLPSIDWELISRADPGGGGGAVRQEFEIKYPRPRFLRLYAAPLDGDSKGSSGLALILHDATDARQATSEAIESERLHALTLLAASVAHEIGNPLNALHIHLQLFERELKRLKLVCGTTTKASRNNKAAAAATDVGPDIAEITGRLDGYLQVAQGEITRLDYIVTEFIQALRPKPPRLAEAALNDVVRETLQVLGPELENRGLRVEFNPAPRLPVARFDAAQLKQVLVNLIKNAMQAMTRGGTLTLATGAAPNDIWVSVSDTGIGIPVGQQKLIFEPFYTTKTKGTGLGLMIVERIMRDHGGRIELVSQVDQGTTFRLWLPLPNRGPKLLAEGGD